MEMGLGGAELEENSLPTNHSELFVWPSNTTLESNTSTAGFAEDITNSYPANIKKLSHNQQKGSELTSGSPFNHFNEPPINRIQRSISSLFFNRHQPLGKYNSIGDIFVKSRGAKENSKSENSKRKLQKILGRRQSSSSGQWKGVRWKPVIDDLGGDNWSDNSNHCNVKQAFSSTAVPQHKCTQCSCWSQTEELGNPMPVRTLIQSGVSHRSEPNIGIDSVSDSKHKIVTFGQSLPNLSVIYSSTLTVPHDNKSTRKIHVHPIKRKNSIQ